MDCNMSFTKYVLPLPVQPATIIANGCPYFTPDSGGDVICDVCTTAGFPCNAAAAGSVPFIAAAGGGGARGGVPLIATNGGVGGGGVPCMSAAGGGGVPLIATSGGMGSGVPFIGAGGGVPLIAAASGCGVPLIAAAAGVPCVSSMF